MTTSTDPTAPPAGASTVRRLETAIASTRAKLQHAEAARDRAQARVLLLTDELERLRVERDHILTDRWPTLPAPARLVTIRGLWYWAVACPYCGKEHHHGGSETVPPAGPRLRHCAAPFDPGRSYDIVPVEAGA